jgi:hypothetical protein
MEDLDNSAIEDLPVVISVCLHTGVTSSYGVCGAKMVDITRKSIERPTTVDYLREFGRVIQRDHGPRATCIAATQQLQTTEKDDTDVSTKRAADADEGCHSITRDSES